MTEGATRAWATSYRAAWVLPMASAPVRGGAVVVQGDRIAWVGRAGDEPADLKARVVELGDAVLTPGLVNAHTHLDLTVLRGLLPGGDFFAWIRAVVACRAALTPDELLDSARLGVIEGLETGVTAFADTSPGAASFEAMHELGVRGIAYVEVFGPDPATAPAALADLRRLVASLRSRHAPLIGVGVSPHAPYSVSDKLYAAACDWARHESLPIATHVAEGADESLLVTRGEGAFAAFLRGRDIPVAPRARSPVELLFRCGVLGPDALLIHCVQCDAPDVEAVARSGAAVATCPASNAFFGHGPAPVAAFAAAGVRIGLGSDSAASNPAMDLLAEAAEVRRHAADVDDPSGWRLATRDGARSLGLDGTAGSLVPGMAADLAAFPVGDRAADTSPPSAAPGTRASLVVVAGVERVREGRVVGDDGAVRTRAAAVTARIREWRLRAAPG